MANINDYLLWRGDLPINDKFSFNEIDSMILARFSYLRFDKIKVEPLETIESISNKMKDLDNEEFRYNGDKELITYLGQSERFKIWSLLILCNWMIKKLKSNLVR